MISKELEETNQTTKTTDKVSCSVCRRTTYQKWRRALALLERRAACKNNFNNFARKENRKQESSKALGQSIFLFQTRKKTNQVQPKMDRGIVL